MSDEQPVVFDHDNPEWTDEDFARARPIADYPELADAFARAKNKGGRPRGTDKQQVTLRLDREVLDRFKAGGPGWQTRINEALKRVAI